MCWYPLLALFGVCCCLAGASAANQPRVVYLHDSSQAGAVVNQPTQAMTMGVVACPHCESKNSVLVPVGLPAGSTAHVACSVCLLNIPLTLMERDSVEHRPPTVPLATVVSQGF